VVETDEEEGRYVLYRVGDVERLSDGRLVIANVGSQELLLFDPTGDFIESWGGRGQGPGEFTRIWGIYPCEGDRLLIREARHITVFDSSGAVLRDAPTPIQTLTNTAGYVRSLARGVSPDCASILLGTWFRTAPQELSDAGFTTQPTLMTWIDGGETSIDTLGVFPEYEVYRTGSEVDAGMRWFAFTFRSSWATWKEHVYWGWGEEPEVQVLSRTGNVVKIIRWAGAADTITADDWRAYDAERNRWLEGSPHPLEVAMIPTSEDHPRERFRQKPYFAGRLRGGPLPDDQLDSAFRVDEDGNLWIRRYRRPPIVERTERFPLPAEHWWVFSREGRWLGEVRGPPNFRLKSIRGGYVLGVTTDEFDVEEVRVYRIVKP